MAMPMKIGVIQEGFSAALMEDRVSVFDGKLELCYFSLIGWVRTFTESADRYFSFVVDDGTGVIDVEWPGTFQFSAFSDSRAYRKRTRQDLRHACYDHGFIRVLGQVLLRGRNEPAVKGLNVRAVCNYLEIGHHERVFIKLERQFRVTAENGCRPPSAGMRRESRRVASSSPGGSSELSTSTTGRRIATTLEDASIVTESSTNPVAGQTDAASSQALSMSSSSFSPSAQPSSFYEASSEKASSTASSGESSCRSSPINTTNRAPSKIVPSMYASRVSTYENSASTTASSVKNGRKSETAKRQSGVPGVSWDGTNKSWRAHLYENGKKKTVHFSVRQHGDDEALRLAIECRQRAAASGRASTKKRAAPEFQSGVKGVSWHATNGCWCAKWYENKRMINRLFKLGDYGGFEGAKQAVIAHRKLMEEKHYVFR